MTKRKKERIEEMRKIFAQFGLVLTGVVALAPFARANSWNYPAVRYLSPYSESMGSVTAPLADEVGNDLFNNPAALARNSRFKAEILNLNLDVGSNTLGDVGVSTLGVSGLKSMVSSLNANQNNTYASGFGNLTALSWGGLGVGLLIQDRSRAYSDGTNVHYQTDNELVPAVGYGLALARGVIRLGASIQYVNQVSGTNSFASTSTGNFTSGVDSGHGFSTTASGSIIFPFTYLPTITFVGRNIGGMHFTSGTIYPKGDNIQGQPDDLQTSVDAAFNFMVRISGQTKSYWFIQMDDITSSYSMPFLERFHAGIDFHLNEHVGLRVGVNSTQLSGGIGYKSEQSEINLAYYHEASPFSSISYWDTRFALQYKVYFQDKNTRDRESENKSK